MVLNKLIRSLVGADQKASAKKAEAYRNLIRREAKIGGEMFGPIPKGHRREFFCLDEHTWVWYEEWLDASSHRHSKTTRYDVRPSGIVKLQEGQPTRNLTVDETRNLRQAVRLYKKRFAAEYDIS